jgi:universal stress protein E
MRRFQNILYATRGTQDEQASLKQALSLARNNAATLQILAVCPMLPRKLGEYQAGYEASVSDRISASIANTLVDMRVAPDAVRTAVAVECGDTPAVRIVRRVLRDAHDLLIKQAEQTERGIGFPALDMQLLRLCPCPVWLCRPISRHRNETRVGVAVDPQSVDPAGRDLALQLIHLSRSLADMCSGELSIISCWDFQYEDTLRHSPWVKIAEEEIVAGVTSAERDARGALDRLVDESGIAGPNRVHLTRGRPDRAIPQLVDKLQLDILVMGTVGRIGIPGFIIGNTAENTLREIRCALLAVKPNGFVSPVRAY